MLVALAGWIAKYDGKYEFKSAEKYPDHINYVLMRTLLAIFGALLPPLYYNFALELSLPHEAAIFTGAAVLLENGLISICRPILLDSMLIFFSSLAIYCYTKFLNSAKSPFSFTWCIHLLQTGVAIGIVSSIKWVGFFITAHIGVLTIFELIEFLKTSKTWKGRLNFVKHFLARSIALIVVPVSIYVASFWLHFRILNHTGPGDANMSSLFQSRLRGNLLKYGPSTVHYGSTISIKSNSYGGGLLHSHLQTYPTGSKQQQVTTYHHKDNNNIWTLTAANGNTTGAVKNGERIKLLHKATDRFLHSHHTFNAPKTTTDFEVTGYGGPEIADPNDLWEFEIAKQLNGNSSDHALHPMTTKFRLKHVVTGCYLKAKNTQLPEWGFKQGEVSCDPDHRARFETSTLWNVEEHTNSECKHKISFSALWICGRLSSKFPGRL